MKMRVSSEQKQQQMIMRTGWRCAVAADQKDLASTRLIPRIVLIYDFSLAFYERASVWREGTH